MTSEDLKPTILLAFSKPRDDLAQLERERDEIVDVLAVAKKNGLLDYELLPDATIERLQRKVEELRETLVVIHFAGHANESDLFFAGEGETVVGSDGQAVARFLTDLPHLRLVFLNACRTFAHVEALLNSRIDAVISTKSMIKDEVAAEFAIEFYRWFRSLRLGEAYAKAENAIASRYRGAKLYRHDADLPLDEGDIVIPWQLDPSGRDDPAVRWSLVDGLDPKEHPLAAPLGAFDGVRPESPYRGIETFHGGDAHWFYGRAREIWRLFDLLDPDGREPPELILLHGAAGVGKSSLLHAGFLPRIPPGAFRFDVVTCRQHASLYEQLESVMRAGEGDRADRRPHFAILDQFDDAFRHRSIEEQGPFLQHFFTETRELRRAFGARAPLLLCFRKEALADVLDAAARVMPRLERVHVPSLDRRGVLQAIKGPEEHFSDLFVQPEAAMEIATRLLQDADSETPVAPTLQLLMSQLWTKAKSHDNRDRQGRVVISLDLFREMNRSGDLLLEFINDQVRRTAPEPSEQGLLLDLLDYHVGAAGSLERSRQDLDARYHHITKLGALLEKCTQPTSRLLLELEGSYRLSHDALTGPIRVLFRESMLPGQTARRLLESQASGSSSFLGGGQLRQVRTGRRAMRAWRQDEVELVRRSRRRCWRNWSIALIILLALMVPATHFALDARTRGVNERGRTLLVSRGEDPDASKSFFARALGYPLASRSVREEARLGRFDAWRQAPPPLMTVNLGTSPIWQVEWLDRDRSVLVARDDQTVQKVDVLSGRCVASFALPSEAPGPVVYHPKLGEYPSVAMATLGDRIVVGGRDGKIYVLSGADLTADQPLASGPSSITALAVYAEQQGVYSVYIGRANGHLDVTRLDGTMHHSSLGEDRPVHALDDRLTPVMSMAVSPDGRTLASVGLDYHLRIRDLDAGTEQAAIDHGNEIYEVCFTATGRIVTTCEDGIVRQFEQIGDSWRRVATVDDIYDAQIWTLAVARDSRFAAVGLQTSGARLIEIGSSDRWQVTSHLTAHSSKVLSTVFSSDGRYLATADEKGVLAIWTASPGAPFVTTLEVSDSSVFDVELLENDFLLTAGRELVLWDARLATRVHSYPIPPPAEADRRTLLRDIEIIESEAAVVGVGETQFVSKWFVDDPDALQTSMYGPDRSDVIRRDGPDRRRLVVGDHQHRVSVLELDLSGAPVAAYDEIHEEPVRAVAIDPAGRWMVTGGMDDQLFIWEHVGENWDAPAHAGAHEDDINWVVFEDADTVLTGGSDGYLRRWQLSEGRLESSGQAAHDGSVMKCAVFGRHLVISVRRNGIRLWHRSDLRPAWHFPDAERITWGLAISERGDVFATSSNDGRVRVWWLSAVEDVEAQCALRDAALHALHDEDDRNDITAWRNLAAWYLWYHEPELAAAALHEAIEGDSGSGSGPDLVDDYEARLWFAVGEFEEARPLAERAAAQLRTTGSATGHASCVAPSSRRKLESAIWRLLLKKMDSARSEE